MSNPLTIIYNYEENSHEYRIPTILQQLAMITSLPAMNELPLDWYRAHPFVQMWRSQDSNSFFSTVKELNAQLNVDVNRPFTISRVEPIITHYLNELCRYVRKETCDKIRSRKDMAQKFGLNKTEIQFIINSKTKIKDE